MCPRARYTIHNTWLIIFTVIGDEIFSFENDSPSNEIVLRLKIVLLKIPETYSFKNRSHKIWNLSVFVIIVQRRASFLPQVGNEGIRGIQSVWPRCVYAYKAASVICRSRVLYFRGVCQFSWLYFHIFVNGSQRFSKESTNLSILQESFTFFLKCNNGSVYAITSQKELALICIKTVATIFSPFI